jgi:6-pyruvoyltetrahydropterin/6-carboxytetrahydropterin synthase
MGTTIFREFTFEAAHRLPNVPHGHKCATLHGHSYKVRIEIEGELDPQAGWFCDWADIDCWWNHVYTTLDHRTLNEIPGLENPTCEHLAAWLWEKLIKVSRGLKRIVINEGPRGGVEYEGVRL